jgi:hypothetical protein
MKNCKGYLKSVSMVLVAALFMVAAMGVFQTHTPRTKNSAA